MGMRTLFLLLVPASGLLAVAAAPALSAIRLGQLDASGTRLVALVLAGYLIGLTAYSLFFLLTRASYALEDARRPTLVNLGVTVVSVVVMVIATRLWSGTDLLVSFGLIQAVALTVGAVVLFLGVQRAIHEPVEVTGALVRALASGVVAITAAYAVTAAIGWPSRSQALVAAVAGGGVGVALYVAGLALLRTPELATVRAAATRRRGRGRP